MTYQSKLNILETEIAIKYIKDQFEIEFSKALSLTRVSAPLMVLPETGLNDQLNGIERPVQFDILDLGQQVEIVQSLAKWKRMALQKYGFQTYTGLYTDMNAIRRDEKRDAIHSIYVDQWDWEKIILENDRNLSYLFETVQSIYQVILSLNQKITMAYPLLETPLPNEIFLISTFELAQLYPNLSRKERENAITQEKRAVFLYQIGWPLEDGLPHDGRATDYDDWNLNGDILLWYDTLSCALEISSMGIRVDANALYRQLQEKGEMEKLNNPYVQAILQNQLPLTIGGGIGQSRLCMYFLKKAHIGEVQSSVWSDEMILSLKQKNIHLL
ncbi:MAG: aspartate--ammonia ligase [Prevotella sp.]|nr:aspartate--ammonia ligase [Staphylococcus sp.]MCM1349824.1 aspartate--ammonia ligase [Prevotella sp.]